MTVLLYSVATTEAEVDLAIKLATDVFSARSDILNYDNFKDVLWRQDPAYSPNNLILARAIDGSVRGLVRVVPRTIYRGNEPFSVAGLSSVCLHCDERGKGKSIELIEYALQNCHDRGFDFAFLFARRSADYYYNRFGFYGISSYNRLSVKHNSIEIKHNLELGPAKNDEIDIYSSAYDRCYANTFGRVERSPSYWRFLLYKFQYYLQVKIMAIYESGFPVGYVILDDSVIYELAIDEQVDSKALVTLIVQSLNKAVDDDWVNFELPPQHTLLPMLQGMDVQITQRECPFGGHMACILNIEADNKSMVERYPASAGALGSINRRPKLSYKETCQMLKTARITGATDGVPGFGLPFNMSLADHF